MADLQGKVVVVTGGSAGPSPCRPVRESDEGETFGETK
jgi:hypothetical protein